MTQTESAQFIKQLQQFGMTEEQKKVANLQELVKQFGIVITDMTVLLGAATIIWAVLTFIFALNIAWIKVLGAYFLFNFLKNTIIRSLKK